MDRRERRNCAEGWPSPVEGVRLEIAPGVQRSVAVKITPEHSTQALTRRCAARSPWRCLPRVLLSSRYHALELRRNFGDWIGPVPTDWDPYSRGGRGLALRGPVCANLTRE